MRISKRDIAIVFAVAAMTFLATSALALTWLQYDSPELAQVVFKHYLPHEPAQEHLLGRHSWNVQELIAWDLQIPVQSLLDANQAGLAWNPGQYVNVPIPQHHSWVACASYYGLGDGTNGSRQADGSIFYANDISIASKELPKGSFVTVKFPHTGVTVKHVQVTDSGPYYATCNKWPHLPRAFDLSWGLMLKGFNGNGTDAIAAGLAKIRVTLESLPENKIVKK